MAETHYKPRSPGRYGAIPVFHSRTLGANPLTANTTVTLRVGAPFRRCWIERITISQATVAADSDGTILATAYKYDDSANAEVALTSALSLESDVFTANESEKMVFLTTLTNAQRTLDEGDTIHVKVVNNSAAIDTQPVDLQFVVEFLVLE